MEGAWRKLGGNADIENARRFLGLVGKPAYTVTPVVGKVSDTFYMCTLEPENGAFRAKFSQAPNPTDKEINTRVWKNKVFDLGPALDQVVTIPAGGSVTVGTG